MKITILGREIELKSSFRSYMIYENITGKSFQSLTTLADIITFMYANVLAVLKSPEISFEEFLDFIDENPNEVTKFSEWMVKGNAIINTASNDDIDKPNSKKKTTKKKA